MASPVTNYPTPLQGQFVAPGLMFAGDGSGLLFDAGYPLTFPALAPLDIGSLFPTVIPEVEQIIYQAVNDAANTRLIFPDDGDGLLLPATFNLLPNISLYAGKDSSYGAAVIPVVRGWPTYPGVVPAIGVALSTEGDDPSGRVQQGGFAGDVYAVDSLNNVIATCAYYAEPLYATVIVELIHENRDERDRLHDQLRRVIYPLRHVMPSASSQIREVQISAEKQELPLDEQPLTVYISLFTVEVWAEALIPTEIVVGGAVNQLATTVTTTVITHDPNPDDFVDLT